MTISEIEKIVDPKRAYSFVDSIVIKVNGKILSINFIDLPEDFDSDDAEYLMDDLGSTLYKRSDGEIEPKGYKFLGEHTVSLMFAIAC